METPFFVDCFFIYQVGSCNAKNATYLWRRARRGRMRDIIANNVEQIQLQRTIKPPTSSFPNMLEKKNLSVRNVYIGKIYNQTYFMTRSSRVITFIFYGKQALLDSQQYFQVRYFRFSKIVGNGLLFDIWHQASFLLVIDVLNIRMY